MTIHDIRLFSLAPGAGVPAMFADPDWRGLGHDSEPDRKLRPLSDIRLQVARLEGWISAGRDYGWLGAYQARRAAFELQSARAQMHRDIGRKPEGLADDDRLAVQARLDRLEACLLAARAEAQFG